MGAVPFAAAVATRVTRAPLAGFVLLLQACASPLVPAVYPPPSLANVVAGSGERDLFGKRIEVLPSREATPPDLERLSRLRELQTRQGSQPDDGSRFAAVIIDRSVRANEFMIWDNHRHETQHNLVYIVL